MKKHKEMVATLCKSGNMIAKNMTGAEAHALHMAVGISGESGELLDQIKKHVIYKKPINIENVIEELGDLEFYIEGLRQGFNLSRETILQHNIDKLSKRYEGLKYTDKAAIDRADKK